MTETLIQGDPVSSVLDDGSMHRVARMSPLTIICSVL